MRYLVKTSAACKCHTQTIKLSGPVSVYLFLHNKYYRKIINLFVTVFRLNNKTREEQKKTFR